MLNYYEFNAERMDIIMFKPCYPGSQISNNDTQYDGTTENNGYGNVIGGTPYSDNGNNNFQYLNSTSSVSESYSSTYWTDGYWSGANSSLAQLKCMYRGMLNIFVHHPDILFIAMQAPPIVNLSDDEAANCREFARWLREDWLHQYDPTGTDSFEDYPEKNIVPFDFHNSIAWTGDDPILDNEYFWFIQDGLPDNTLDTTDPNLLGRNAGNNNHPEEWLNQRTATIFCGGTDTFSSPHTEQPQRTYDCWINAVVNRWEKRQQPVPVEFNSLSVHLKNNNAILEWSTITESNNYGFEIQRSKNNAINFKKIGFVYGKEVTSNVNHYHFVDKNLSIGKYYYRLKQIDNNGSYQYSNTIKITIKSSSMIHLFQNYPNPFNSVTRIKFSLFSHAHSELKIYNLLGETIKILLNEKKSAGEYHINWNGTNDASLPVPSGVYICRLKTNSIVVDRKIILLR